MTTESIKQEELNRLYGISTMPAVAFFALVIVYYGFVHLEQINHLGSLMLDLLLNMFLLILIPMPAVFFLTFEILCNRRIKGSKLNMKRFLGRMITVLIGALLFVMIYLASYFFLAPLISERLAVLCSLWIWLMILGMIMTKFRHLLGRLEKGELNRANSGT